MTLTPRNHLFSVFHKKIPPSSVFPRSCPGKWGVKIHEMISKCNTGRRKKQKTRTIFTFGIIIRKVMMRTTEWWWFWGVLACVSELGHDLKFKRQKRVVGFMTLKAFIVYHRYASNICKLQCRIHDMHSLWECHRVGEKIDKNNKGEAPSHTPNTSVAKMHFYHKVDKSIQA